MTVALDPSDFESPDFDPSKWVDLLCASRPEGQSMENFLADSQARLQVLIDASTLSLEEATAAVLERVSAAAADAACLEADAAILHGAVASALDRVATAAEAAEAATAPLAALERVRSAAEATARTLDEGASLAGLLAGADDLLAAGDVAVLGRALEGIRSGLAAVGDLPEFAGGAARLARLQARLTALVEPLLAAALAVRAGGRAAELAALLDGALGVRKQKDIVGKGAEAPVSSSLSSSSSSSTTFSASSSSETLASDPLPRLFAAARSPELAAAWDAFDAGAPAGFVGWLPGFYAAAEDALTADARWAAAALPSRAPELVAALVTAAARGADRSFRARLAASLAPLGGSRALEQLSAVARAARSHAASVARMLEGAPRAAAEAALAAIVAPVEAELASYGELEAAALASDLAAAVGNTWTLATAAAAAALQQQQLQGQTPLLRPADASDALYALGRSVRESTASATARCLDLTGGSGLPALLSAADAAFSRAAATAAATLRASPPSVADGETGAATELLPVAAAAESAATAAAVDASVALRACILRAVPPLLESASAAASGSSTAPWNSNNCSTCVPGSDFDAFVHAARVRASPELRAALDCLVSAAASTSDAGPAATTSVSWSSRTFSPLPASGSAFAELVAAARGAVRRALLAEVTAPLANVASLRCWESKSGGGVAAAAAADSDASAAAASADDDGSGGGSLSLPSFSAYPQAWATAAGEALLALPAALESALEAQRSSDEPSPSSSAHQQQRQQEQQQVDDGSAWLDEVTADAASAALAQVGSIGSLSASGVAQLAADLGYFCGVLRTLGASVPAPLTTWAAASSWPEAAFEGGAVDAAVARGEVDPETVRLVAAVRGIATA